MENGTAVIINNKVYEIGTVVEIAGAKHEVYNTMPGLNLIGFAKLTKSGKRASMDAAVSLSFDQIAKFSMLGVIK